MEQSYAERQAAWVKEHDNESEFMVLDIPQDMQMDYDTLEAAIQYASEEAVRTHQSYNVYRIVGTVEPATKAIWKPKGYQNEL